MRDLVDDAALGGWLAEHPQWQQEGTSAAGGGLRRSVECPSFPAAIELVRHVADEAESRNHHPDIDVRWRTVHFALSTHSAGGITEQDLGLAEAIDALTRPD